MSSCRFMSKKTHQMTKCQKRPYLGRYVRRQVDLKRTIICHVNKERSGTWHSRTFCPSVVDDTENPSSEMTQREPPSHLLERDDLSDRSLCRSISLPLSERWSFWQISLCQKRPYLGRYSRRQVDLKRDMSDRSLLDVLSRCKSKETLPL